MSNYNCSQEIFFLKGTSTGILIRDDNHLNSKYFFIVFNFWNVSKEIEILYRDEIDSKLGASPPETAAPPKYSIEGHFDVGKHVSRKNWYCALTCMSVKGAYAFKRCFKFNFYFILEYAKKN